MDRIGTDVRRELDRFGPVGSIGLLVEAWPGVVGESIARNAWPARVARDGTLHVNTSSSAWAFELAQLAPRILSRLRKQAADDAPRALRFAPGSLPELELPEASESGSGRIAPSPEAREEAERIASALEDEELRELVARAAAASLARGVGDRPI